MNLILTSVCNRKCSFCFAKEFVTNSKEEIMDFDFLKKIIDETMTLCNSPVFNLLGGEPTKYPYFVEMMDYIYEGYKKVRDSGDLEKLSILPRICVTSNFLIDDDNVREVIKKVAHEFPKKVAFLLNISEASQEQVERISKEVENCIKPESNVSLSFTVNNTFEYYKKILDLSYAKIIKPRQEKNKNSTTIRMSAVNPQPNSEISFDEYMEKENEKTFNVFDQFVEWCVDHRTTINFDCGITYCMLDDEKREYYRRWSTDKMFNGCGGSAFDIFPNGDISKCYPGSLVKSNYYKYDKLIPCYEEIDIRTSIIRKDKKRMPKKCSTCPHFMKECSGACIGFHNTK